MTERKAEQNSSKTQRKPGVTLPQTRLEGREETEKEDQADSGPDRDHPITRGQVK